MRSAKWMAISLICATALASDAPRGTVPRASADKYAVHAEHDGLNIGATLLTTKQARLAFSSEVNRCCLVVEVALYPQKDGMVEVSLDDFALRDMANDVAVKPSSAEVVAGKLQRETAQSQQSGRDVTITPTSGIGYESGGIDPITGQRRPGGIVTSSGVGVGVGKPEPKPASTDADRRTMELELREKGLPAGNASAPVAGYVYFSLPRTKSPNYQLEYTLNGAKVVMALSPGNKEDKKAQP